jgi:hypothetical protein
VRLAQHFGIGFEILVSAIVRIVRRHEVGAAIIPQITDMGGIRVVRPERFELPTFWFVARAAQNLSAFSGVAYEPETPFRPSQLSVDCP